MTNAENQGARERLIHIHQGECRITEDANVVITTMLGSCVAACLYDLQARVGGMNHFLLPETDDLDRAATLRYGAHSMELLVNGLLSIGAKRERLEAKLFGGAQFVFGVANVGQKNVEFAKKYLKREGIPVIGGSLGGRQARRIQFWPVLGRARQLALDMPPELVAKSQPVAELYKDAGSVELF